MAIRNTGVKLLKLLVRLGVWLLVVIFWVMAVWTSVPLFGLNGNAVDFPEVPAVDQVMIDKAAASEGGVLLRKQLYAPTIKVSDTGLIDFLDEQSKRAGVSNPGPYVVFSQGRPKVNRADASTPPDAIVDANNGIIVAASQEYAKERGAACFNVTSIDVLTTNWVMINTYLHGKLMPLLVPVNKEVLPDLTGNLDTNCYIYPT